MTMLTVRRKPNGTPGIFNVFEDFFNRSLPDNFLQDNDTFSPSVNVSETEKEFRLEFAAPGFDKKDFNVNVDRDTLTVSAERENKTENKEGNYTRKEFSYGSFKRMFTLPENVDDENIQAVYENGILNLILPKKKQIM
jgi:HSP20 family protein